MSKPTPPDEPQAPVILTPGPVTTSPRTKQAMERDYSPNEPDLLALSADIRRAVIGIANGGDAYACVLLQGTGHAANEATLGTFVPRDEKILIVNNGQYGARLIEMACAIGLTVVPLDLPLTQPVRGEDVARALARDPSIGHVALCHVDTGTGILNPLPAVAEVCRAKAVPLIIDAIASFGGLPLDVQALDPEAVVISPNKWLEGVPGLGLVLAKKTALARAKGRSRSYCLDVHAQWECFERTGRWRFTPPTIAAAALAAALCQHADEGQAARLARVRANWRCLVDGLRALGFETLIPDEVASPVIATFHEPADPAYDRERFFQAMRERGFIMFRGRLTAVPTFRIGCMGAFDAATMRRAVEAVAAAMAEMGVRNCGPAVPVAAAE